MAEANALMPAAAAAALTTGGRIAPIVPQSWNEVVQMAGAFSRSGMVPRQYEGSAEKVAIAILAGLEVGLTPLAAVQSIYIINNTPTLYGDALLALVRGSGLLEDFLEEQELDDEGLCQIATCKVKRKGEASWGAQIITRPLCAKAGWLTKAGPWTQTPQRMMQMRARGWALRDKFADVLKGIKPAEEMEDMVDVTAEGHAITTPPMPTRADFVRKEGADTDTSAPSPSGLVVIAVAATADKPVRDWSVNVTEPGEEPKRRAIVALVAAATTEAEVDEIAEFHKEFLGKLGRTLSETRTVFRERKAVLRGEPQVGKP